MSGSVESGRNTTLIASAGRVRPHVEPNTTPKLERYRSGISDGRVAGNASGLKSWLDLPSAANFRFASVRLGQSFESFGGFTFAEPTDRSQCRLLASAWDCLARFPVVDGLATGADKATEVRRRQAEACP